MNRILRRLLRTGFALLALAALAGGLASRAGSSEDGARARAEARLAALAADDANAAYRLALDLEAAGFADLARRAYEKVVAVEPDHPAARRALGQEKVDGRWLTGDDLQRAKGFVRHQGRWMTAQEFAEATRPEREKAEQQAGEARVLRLLAGVASGDETRAAAARRQMLAEEARYKLAPLAQALRSKPTALRLYAAETLARLRDPLGVPALLKRTVEDPEESVRTAAALALKEIGSPSTIEPLVRALDSRYSDVRVRAAEAIGYLGDELGYPAVIMRWEGRSGDFPRVYFSQTKQISYIQDFDVEVAQTSFIADPIVGVLQEGVVNAVKVLATEQSFTFERAAYHRSLARLAGTDLGEHVGEWRAWWEKNKDRLLEERAARLRKGTTPR